MKIAILVMLWVTVLVVGISFAAAGFVDGQRVAAQQAEYERLRAMNRACMDAVDSRFSTSGDANIKDIYSYNTPDEVWMAKHQARLQCAIMHPPASAN
jgi:hypothetical protein